MLLITLLVDVSQMVRSITGDSTHTRDSSESVSEYESRLQHISGLKQLTELISQ